MVALDEAERTLGVVACVKMSEREINIWRFDESVRRSDQILRNGARLPRLRAQIPPHRHDLQVPGLRAGP
jgi:hypothetical protein